MKNELKRDSNFLPAWTDGEGKIFEAVFAEEYIKKRPMRCIHGRLFTVDGMIEDQNAYLLRLDRERKEERAAEMSAYMGFGDED